MGPTRYGKEYHGTMDHKECEQMLKDKPDGSYLVRRSPGADNYYTLSLRFGQATKHFKIFYCPEKGHYLRENFKKFETVEEMVADGLVDFYMRLHAAPILKEMMSQTKKCYEQSPYMTLHRRKLRSLCKPTKLPMVQDSLESADTEIADDRDGGAKGADQEQFEKSDTHDNAYPEYEKQHAFKTHTFKGLNWCEFCANFLWGFTSQGVKCDGKIELTPPYGVPIVAKEYLLSFFVRLRIYGALQMLGTGTGQMRTGSETFAGNIWGRFDHAGDGTQVSHSIHCEEVRGGGGKPRHVAGGYLPDIGICGRNRSAQDGTG